MRMRICTRYDAKYMEPTPQPVPQCNTQNPASLELLLFPRDFGPTPSFPPRIDTNRCLSSLCRGSSYVTRVPSSSRGSTLIPPFSPSAPGSGRTGRKTTPFLGVPNTNVSPSTSSTARSFSLFKDYKQVVNFISSRNNPPTFVRDSGRDLFETLPF